MAVVAKDERLTARAAAERLGIKPDTWWSYVNRAAYEREVGRDRPNLAPPPDGREELSGTPWWWASTIDAWKANRPGRGARTDRAGH